MSDKEAFMKCEKCGQDLSQQDWRARIIAYFPFVVDGKIGFSGKAGKEKKKRMTATIAIPEDQFGPDGDLRYPDLFDEDNIDLVVCTVRRRKKVKSKKGNNRE